MTKSTSIADLALYLIYINQKRNGGMNYTPISLYDQCIKMIKDATDKSHLKGIQEIQYAEFVLTYIFNFIKLNILSSCRNSEQLGTCNIIMNEDYFKSYESKLKNESEAIPKPIIRINRRLNAKIK
jgi:hypothetical protein